MTIVMRIARVKHLALRNAARNRERGAGAFVVTGENFTRRALWRHRDFLKLWCAETVSQLGSQMTLLALPLIAISVMHADVLEVGTLSAIEVPAVCRVRATRRCLDRPRGAPPGPDRERSGTGRVCSRRYRLRGRSVFSHFGKLYIVAFCVGTLTVFFDVAYEALLPTGIGQP